ncbi:hypothetical protein D3C80_1681390 [compost metagenome]
MVWPGALVALCAAGAWAAFFSLSAPQPKRARDIRTAAAALIFMFITVLFIIKGELRVAYWAMSANSLSMMLAFAV